MSDQEQELRLAIAHMHWRYRDEDEPPACLIKAERELEELVAKRRSVERFLRIFEVHDNQLIGL